jgi:small-conductance mechanosensitive channel
LGGALTLVMSLGSAGESPSSPSLNLPLDTSLWGDLYYLLDDLLVAFIILILVAFISLSNAFFSNLNRLISSWRKTRFRPLKIQNLELLNPHQMTNLLVLLSRGLHIALVLLVTACCLTLIFSFYPVTQGLAMGMFYTILDAVASVWGGILSILPNLLTLTIIILITRLCLKVLRFFYLGLRRGKINIAGVHPELAEPTYQLSRLMVIAFALVAAFPYIPGSSSPAFKGLSILVGFLVSMGSTSLVTNIVSGVVLTYTRGLKIGDRVRIADTTGDVVDRTLLVTRIRTIKNVIVTIPNGMVLQNQIVNYSAAVEHQGLILNTSVTIGYDVPWRQVHALLTDAARQTPHILADPPPFVLQTSLDDFYISYELNAYTDAPQRMAGLYSRLHQNILDQFNQAGVEIMSPSYFAMRDGQAVTTPAQVHYSAGNGRVK